MAAALRSLLAAFLLCWPVAALAVQPHEVLSDPGLEARARAISAELRCLVCQNQSIDDSDAELAGDLRLLVRERLVAGDSDQQVLSYVTDRYGEFVLLNPRFGWHTVWLWLAAPVLLLCGVLGLRLLARKGRKDAAEAPASGLTQGERAALERLQSD